MIDARLGMLLMAAAISSCGGSASRIWRTKDEPTCAMPSGTAETDRQRAFLAALIALEERGYTVVRMRWPKTLEAHYYSAYKPEIYQTRWVINVLPNAHLEFSAPSPWHRTHSKTDQWFERLYHTIQRYQCRDPEWLRWRAEERGLLPIGLGVEPSQAVALADGGVDAGSESFTPAPISKEEPSP